MEWAEIKAAIKALIATLAGVPALWRDEPRPFGSTATSRGAYVLLNVTTTRGFGSDEVRYQNLDENGDETETPALADSIRPDLAGQRQIVLSVQPETLDQRAEYSAMVFAERIRTRLAWPSSLTTLQAAGLGLAKVGPSTVLDYVHDGRNYSRALVEVTLGCASNESDAALGFIETILLTTQVADEAGNVLPSPPNLIDEELPT
jgi:hypothetical protein